MDALGTEEDGALIYHNGSAWVILSPGSYSSGQQLTITDPGAALSWGNAASDYRAKKDVEEINSEAAGIVIDKLRPVTFRWKRDDHEGAGFIAHEVGEFLPYMLSGKGKDAVDDKGNPIGQGLDKTQIIPFLVSEVQSLRRRLTAAGIK